jgi:hypothetical protein
MFEISCVDVCNVNCILVFLHLECENGYLVIDEIFISSLTLKIRLNVHNLTLLLL